MTCNPKLYRKRQMLGKPQASCGILEPLSADDGKLRVEVGQDATPEVNMNERNLALRYLSKVPNVPGAIMGKMSFMSEIVGSGDVSIVPESDTYLRGCGLSRLNLNILEMVIPSNTSVVRNALLVGQTSSAVGRLVVPLDGSEIRAYIEVISGTFVDTELIDVQGGATGIFTMSGAPVVGGFSYVPISENFEYLTLRSEEDGYKKTMNDAMGTFTISAESSTIGKFEFEFSGVVDKKAFSAITTATGVTFSTDSILYSGQKTIEVLRAYDSDDADLNTLIYRNIEGVAVNTDVYTDGTDSLTIAQVPEKAYFGDGAMTDNIDYYDTVPPILQDSKTQWGGFQPIFNSVSFDLANEVSVRANANSHTGLASAFITARTPSGSIDPEMTESASDFDFYNSWFDGELNEMQFRFGEVQGNGVWVFMPQIQAQSVADADKEGMSGNTYDFEAKGENDNELEIVFI
jgi:hypothetical protein